MPRAPRTPTPPRARSTLPPREAQPPAASGGLGPGSLGLLATPRHTCLRLGDPARGPVPPPRPQPRPPRLGKQLQMRSPAPAHPLAVHTASAVFIGLCTRPSRALDTTSFLALEAEEKEMDTPDSASRVFCGRFLSMVNTDDVNAIILAQKNMLDRFEKTNEMLLNFNNLSSVRLQQMSERFMHHTRTLVDMKRDLDSIFRRIRTLKGKLARQHPEAFSHIPEGSFLEDEDEDPIPPSITTTIATSEQSTGSCDTSPDTVSPSLSPGFEDLSHIKPGSPAINGHRQTDDEEETHEE